MTDYGHDLMFGTFITPGIRPTRDEVVELARLADAARLDLVTFQDHPYQPAFLDTWTLLVLRRRADRARRISAPNVLNLPLRQPACSPAPPPAWTCSAAAGSSSASAPARSGTRSRPSAAAGSPPARPSTRSRRRSGSSARSGPSTSPAACGSTASTTGWSAPSAARRRRTTSASGSARTSRGCCGSPARVADGWLPTLRRLESPHELAAMNARIDEAASPPGASRRTSAAG